MTAVIQHYLNPLHIYCRLRNLGLAKGHAAFLCRAYERIIFKRLILKVTAGWKQGECF
jgi:hypothetical protein